MKQRFFICKHCGNIIAMVKDTGYESDGGKAH